MNLDCQFAGQHTRTAFRVAIVVLIISAAAGCGGGSSAPATSVALTPSTAQNIDQGQTVSLAATLTNDSGAKGVTWSLSPATGAGTLSGQTATAATYNAPASVSASTSVTITATSVAASTKSASVTVTVTPAPSVSTNSLPAGTIGTSYSQTLQASGGAGTMTWSLASGTLPTGLSLSGGGTISGTPTAVATSTFTVKVTDSGSPAMSATKQLSIVTNTAALAITTSTLPNGVIGTAYNANLQSSGGTAPTTWAVTTGTLPAGLSLSASTGAITGTPTTAASSNFTVTVTDSATPTAHTATQNLSITVTTASAACGSGGESMLNGQYAFMLQGFDASGPVAIGGSFTADGTGKITAGQEDVNSVAGVSNPSLTTAGSSYSVGSDSRGCLTLVAGTTTSTYRFSLASFAGTPSVAAKGHVISFDATGTNVMGVMEKQDPTAFSGAQFSGDFAFGAAAPKAGGGRFAIAGRFTASGGSVTAAVADADDTSAGAQTVPTFTGSYTVGSNGRGTITLSPGGTPVHACFYIVSASEALLMSIDPQTGASANSLFAGSVLKQVGKPFASSALNGSDVLYAEEMGTVSGTSNVQLGLLTTAGSGTFQLTSDNNDGGTITPGVSFSGTYVADASGNGRVTTTGGSHPPVFYLASQDKGFVVGTDSGALAGFFEPQTGGPFGGSSASGNYAFGSISAIAVNNQDQSGVGSFATPNVTGTIDKNNAGALTVGSAFTSTFSIDSTGHGLLPAGCSLSGGTCQDEILIVSPSKFLLLEVASGKTNPNLQVADK
jgi:Putative Ig domain